MSQSPNAVVSGNNRAGIIVIGALVVAVIIVLALFFRQPWDASGDSPHAATVDRQSVAGAAPVATQAASQPIPVTRPAGYTGVSNVSSQNGSSAVTQ